MYSSKICGCASFEVSLLMFAGSAQPLEVRINSLSKIWLRNLVPNGTSLASLGICLEIVGEYLSDYSSEEYGAQRKLWLTLLESVDCTIKWLTLLKSVDYRIPSTTQGIPSTEYPTECSATTKGYHNSKSFPSCQAIFDDNLMSRSPLRPTKYLKRMASFSLGMLFN